MSLVSERFVVAVTTKTITRRCPFCSDTIDDPPGKDANFLVHLGIPKLEHALTQSWADYVSFINHI